MRLLTAGASEWQYVFFASPAASKMTAANLRIDGAISNAYEFLITDHFRLVLLNTNNNIE